MVCVVAMIANRTIAPSMYPERVVHPAPTLEFEMLFIEQGYTLIAGLDEAGAVRWLARYRRAL
jgi:hypothetical protein